MLRNLLVLAGLSLVSALSGLAPSTKAQTAAPSEKVSVQITSLERVGLQRRDDPFLMPVEDVVRFRVGLALQIPPRATVDQLVVILERTLSDGTRKLGRTTVSGVQEVIECSLPRPPDGASYRTFSIRLTGSARLASQGSPVPLPEVKRSFSAEQVKLAEP